MTHEASPAADDGSASQTGRARGPWLRVAQLLLTAFVTWFIFRAVGVQLSDLGTLDPAAWTPHLGWLLGSCLVLMAGYALSARVWSVIVRDMGGPVLGVNVAVRVFMVANLARYVPGKIWQIAGLAALGRRVGVAPTVATAAAVVGQGLSLVAAGLVGSVALIQSGVVGTGSRPFVIAASVAFVAVVALPPVTRGLVRLSLRLARREQPLEWDLGTGAVVRWVAWYVVSWVVYAAAFWMLVRSFGLPGSPMAVGGAFAAAYLLGWLVLVAPAGIGVREGFLTVFLGPIMGPAPAAAVALISRVWTTMVELIPATGLWIRHLQLDGAGGRELG